MLLDALQFFIFMKDLFTAPLVGAIVALVFAVFYGYKAWKGRTKSDVAPTPKVLMPQPSIYKRRINLYGDSIAWGGFVEGNGFGRLEYPPADQLRTLTNFSVIDHSVSGITLNKIYETFFSDGHDGEVTVIEAGINDTIQGLPLEARLRKMIEFEIAFGRKVVLTGLSRSAMQIDGRDATEGLILRLVAEYGVGYANWPYVAYNGVADLKDILHPAQGYSNRLFKSVADEVLRLTA